jgi:hypothetical protein
VTALSLGEGGRGAGTRIVNQRFTPSDGACPSSRRVRAVRGSYMAGSIDRARDLLSPVAAILTLDAQCEHVA